MTIPARTQVKELSDTLSPKYASHKKSFSLKGSASKAPSRLVECTSDSGVVVSVMKIFKSVFQYPATLVSKVPFENIVKHCSGIADTFKTFNFFKGIKNIYDNRSNKDKEGDKLKGKELHARNLGIAGGVFQTVIGAATFTKLLDTFGAIQIAEITAAMGRSSVVGQTLAAIAPFTVVTNFLEIANNIVSIAKSSLTIHKNRKKQAKTRAKIRNFNAKSPDKISAFIESHTDSINIKQKAAVTKLDSLANDVQNTAVTIDTEEANYQKKKKNLDDKKEAVKNSPAVVRFFKTLAPRFQLRKARVSVFRAKDNHDRVCKIRSDLFNKWEKREEKLSVWTDLKQDFDKNSLSNDADNPLRRLIADKKRKWQLQVSGIHVKNFQEGIGITINILATITLLASTILFFSGVATIPATLGITSMFLIISLLGFGNELFKKYKKPKFIVVDVTKPVYSPT